MAFVNYVPGAAGYLGTLDPEEVLTWQFTTNFQETLVSPLNVQPGSTALLTSPVFNPDNLALSGWVTIGDGGECPECPPGGSERPASGMLYPRGQG